MTKELAAPSVSLMRRAREKKSAHCGRSLQREKGLGGKSHYISLEAAEGVFLIWPTVRLSGGAGRSDTGLQRNY